MAASRMTMPLYSALSLFLLATLASCTTLPSAACSKQTFLRIG
jgi:hypothetical protein